MPIDEQARLAALQRYKILDTDPEQAFDDLTMLASHICGTPIALITLLDADRQWFKARVGVTAHETARSVSFCTHAIKQRDIYVVPDAKQDALFKENPFVVGEPGIRFYAGAPLVTPDGHALGTICVVDQVPRRLTAEQTEALEALAPPGAGPARAAAESDAVEGGARRARARGGRSAQAHRRAALHTRRGEEAERARAVSARPASSTW